jgi:protein-disulfide isomerase
MVLVAEVQADSPRARVREDFKSGARAGVNGTPTFFGNGLRDDGPPGLDAMIAAIARHHER